MADAAERPPRLHRGPPLSPAGFNPDPDRLYEVGRNGVPYTLAPTPPEAARALEARIRRWWTGALMVNATVMGIAAGGVLLGTRAMAAWLGLLPVLTAPLLLVAPILRRRGARPARRTHRRRPGDFPPPAGPA